MARQLKWWIGAVLLVCVAVGVVYLPPRATPLFARRYQLLEATPYRLRVQELADAWRSTALELRLLQYRERVRPELERRRALEIPGPAVLLDWPDAPAAVRDNLATRLDRTWHELGLGETKISVGVVIMYTRPPDPNKPRAPSLGMSYLLPDSTNRSTCIVFQQIDRVRDIAPNLGPCAYYAAFGSPGREIGRWLGAREFDLAMWPRWERNRPLPGPQWLLERDQPWFWWNVYQIAPDGVACLAGRSERCRSAVVEPRQSRIDPSHLVALDHRWRLRPPALAGRAQYLADVVRSVGRERFQRFWNSELPADTALTEALRMPVGEWTRRWQADLVPPIPLGPAPSAGPALLGLLLAAAALSLALRTVSRREVR